jgi:uncharacterized protein (TIGR03000 family)
MFRKIIPLLLTGAAAMAMPSFAQAQHGGHGGGGGHVGGAHMGGGHVGGSFGGFHPNGFRGFHNDFRGFRNGFGGFYPYYGGYGYYSPYYYGGDYSYPSYSATPDYSGSTYVPPSTGNYQSMYPTTTSAHITINVPADAKVWFDDTPTKSTGAVRQYTTPPLDPGTHYSYDIRAQWTENGHEVTQSQKVQFNPGGQVVVNFPSSATTSPETGPVPQKR